MTLSLHDVLHILRNPAWNTAQRIEAAQQQAANMLEAAYSGNSVVLTMSQERATELLRALADQPMGRVVRMEHPRDPGIERMRTTCECGADLTTPPIIHQPGCKIARWHDDEYRKDGDV